MPRFAAVIPTILACLGVAACAAIAGINADGHYVADAQVSSSGSDSGSGGTDASGGSSSSGTTTSSSGTPIEAGSDSSTITPFPGCVDTTNVCEVSCDPSTCPPTTIFRCPDGWECRLDCKNGCAGVTCTGGKSCTFDCTNGTCAEAKCTSPSCTFDCGQGNQCDKAECLGANTFCAQACFTGGSPKPCSKPIRCCTSETRTTCPDPTLCMP